jgi:DNA-binding MarR family transcriptional regulator
MTQVALRWQRRAGRVLRPAGLTYGQFLLAAALAQAPEASQAGLAHAAGMDAMTASVVLRNLERRRLIVRRASAADSRAKRLRLTPAGETALTQARAPLAAAEAAFFAGVAPVRAELASVLASLLGQRARVRVAVRRA